MLKSLSSFACGAAMMLALVVAPAQAQELEAKLKACDACHGADGKPINAQTPIIWGQTTAYLTKQMHDLRGEDRNSPVMSPMAQMIKPEEWRKTAAYYTAKPWPAKTGAATAAAEPAGMDLCAKCHQEKFVGGLPAPRLAGQSYEYLLAAMNSFADDKRTNSQDMATLMKGLSAAQRQEMAKYLAGL
jgi:cytochrome c553